MASPAELQILLTAKDAASATLKTVAGALSGALVGALAEAAKAAADEEAVMGRLQAAVTASGQAWDSAAGPVNAAIERAKSLAFSDDEAAKALTALTTSTGDAKKATELLGPAMDLARLKGMDLSAAAETVGKVAAGNTGVLGRMGIVLKEGATATDALATVQQVAAGQAEKYGASTAGSIDKSKQAIDDFKESIGASLGPVQQYLAILPAITDNAKSVGMAVGGVLPHLGALRVALLTTVIPAIAATVVAMAPILLTIAAVGIAVLLLKTAWENNFGDIQGKTKAVFDFLSGAFTGIVGAIKTAWEKIGPILDGGLAVILAPIRTFTGAISGALELIGRFTGAQIKAPEIPDQVYDARDIIRGNDPRVFDPRDRPPTTYSDRHGNQYASEADLIAAIGGRIPMFHQGGVMPHDGLALLQRGETVTPKGSGGRGDVHLHFHGDVYGVLEFEKAVQRIARDAFLGGGFRGIVGVAG